MICVKNLAGFVSANSDGSWLCISDHKHKEEHHPDPVSVVHSALSFFWHVATDKPLGVLACNLHVQTKQIKFTFCTRANSLIGYFREEA